MMRLIIITVLVTVFVIPCSADEEFAFMLDKGELEKTWDINKDGVDDHWFYSIEDGNIQKVVRDINFDGVEDIVHWAFLRNKKEGQWTKMIYDNNNDGKIDEISYYDENNEVEKILIDSNDDGFLDLTYNLTDKMLFKLTEDLNNDGKPDISHTYTNGTFSKAEIDTDSDDKINISFDNLSDFNHWFSTNHSDRYEVYINRLNFLLNR